MSSNYHLIKNTTKGWTKQPNAVLHDEDLTSDAKVILYALLAVSGNFHITESGLASSLHLSLDRVKKAVKLLKSTGYIDVSKVMNNNRIAGYIWTIADTNDVLRKGDFRKLENPATENPADGISDGRNFSRSETHQTENLPIYEEPKGSEEPKGETPMDEQQRTEGRKGESSSSSPSPTAVNPQIGLEEDEAGLFSRFKDPDSGYSSSEAKASPLPNKTPTQQGVITQRDYMYQQFLKKYPKKPAGKDLAATKQAFFDIPDLETIFGTIMASLDEWCNSVDWNKESGRYITSPLNFILTQKWEEIPRTVNAEIDPGILRFINTDVEDYI